MPLFRLLLRLYPRTYRERYGAEMVAIHHADRAAGRGGAGYWSGLVIDHVKAAAAVRRGRGGNQVRELVADLASGAKALRRAPAFTLFAVATLALGIGATTGVFSVLDRVVLRPLPYAGSERMAVFGLGGFAGRVGPLSGSVMARIREDPGPAEAVAGASATGVVLQDGGDPERTRATRVTRGFFELFGARPGVGRLLAGSDYDAGAPRVAVLGDGFWRDRYGEDPEVVGRTIRLNDETYAVIGVLSRDFVPPPDIVESPDLWIPLQADEEDRNPFSFFLSAVARLRPGTTLAELDEHVDRVVTDVYPGMSNALGGGAAADYRGLVVGGLGSTLSRRPRGRPTSNRTPRWRTPRRSRPRCPAHRSRRATRRRERSGCLVVPSVRWRG